MLLPLPTHTLFPYTTLFRSLHHAVIEDRPGGRGIVLRRSPVRRRQRRSVALDALELDVGEQDLAGPLIGESDRQHPRPARHRGDRKSTRLNSSHLGISYAVF